VAKTKAKEDRDPRRRCPRATRSASISYLGIPGPHDIPEPPARPLLAPLTFLGCRVFHQHAAAEEAGAVRVDERLVREGAVRQADRDLVLAAESS